MRTQGPLEEILRRTMEQKGVSVSQLARELRISRVTVYNFFKGKFSRKLLSRIADFLQISSRTLWLAGFGETNEFDQKLLQAFHSSSEKTKNLIQQMLKILTPPSQTKPTVLVVDDLQDNVDLFVRCLRNDFEVLHFTDPLQALETIKQKKVDAIITDQRMPKMTGTHLLRQVQALGKTMATMIVSAYTDNQSFMEAINEAKVDAFLMKPFKAEELREKVHSLLPQ